jgi:DNA replication protein DnaC
MLKADPRLGVGLRDISDIEGKAFQVEINTVLDQVSDSATRSSVRFYVTRLLYSRIPKDYWILSLPAMQIDEIYKSTVSHYIEHIEDAADNGMGIIFLGANGIGKTSMMCEIGKYAISRLYPVQYLTLPEYIESCRDNDGIVAEWVKAAGFILLDEVDKVYVKRGSDYAVTQIDRLFRSIFNAGKVLLMCSNWSWDEFEKNLGVSICSMLQRKCRLVTMLGSDISPQLQDTFSDRLVRKVDYTHPEIVRMARKTVRLLWDE